MKSNNTIIRLLFAFVICLISIGVQATAYYKNYNVKLGATPTGCGKVYISYTVDNNGTMETDHDAESVDANITVSSSSGYHCKLYAEPNSGWELAGFVTELKESYEDADFLLNEDGSDLLLSGGSVLLGNDEEHDNDGTGDNGYSDAQEKGWTNAPVKQYYAVFKKQDTSVNNVTVNYYHPFLSGEQDASFGTFTNESINDGSQVRLTAIPSYGMRFVAWHNADGSVVSSDLMIEVNNVKSKYSAEFDLLPLTLPAELCTYSATTQVRLDNWNNEELKGYKVTAVGNTLSLKQVQHIGADEGVILQGVANQTYEMTYQGMFLNEDNSDNLLKSTANGPVEANGKIYVLADGNNGIGFYRLKDGESVSRGKAYLELDDDARGFIGFDDDEIVTSIVSVSKNAQTESIIYNLAGQLVNDAYKGIVIKNGRKVIRR